MQPVNPDRNAFIEEDRANKKPKVCPDLCSLGKALYLVPASMLTLSAVNKCNASGACSLHL